MPLTNWGLLIDVIGVFILGFPAEEHLEEHFDVSKKTPKDFTGYVLYYGGYALLIIGFLLQLLNHYY